jgi:AcrR family transcriptional regulator
MENPSQETRTALLKAALVCFAEHGFDGTSMRMIADRAKRPLSLLAHHFGNKEGLYVEVFRMILGNNFSERGLPMTMDEDWKPRDRAEAIRLLREEVHRMYEDVAPLPANGSEPDLLREYGPSLWLQEMRSTRRELSPLLRQYVGPVLHCWRQVIKCLRPELTDAEVVFLGISIIGMIASHGLMSGLNETAWGDKKPVKNSFQASELLVDLCLNGLINNRTS